MSAPSGTAPPGPAEVEALLALAVAAIRRGLAGESQDPAVPAVGVLAEKLPLFVSLRRDGAPLGEVGTLAPAAPAGELACSLARAAAFDDPRHLPLASAAGVEVVLSLVTATRPLTDAATLDLPTEGVRVRRGVHAAVLLPHEGRGAGFDAVTWVTLCCRRAGLPGQAFREPETEVTALRILEAAAPL